MNKIYLTCSNQDQYLKINAFIDNELICEYRLIYSTEFTDSGLEINKATLLSWATIDLMVLPIHINFSLPDQSKKYILSHYEFVKKTYVHFYNVVAGDLSFEETYQFSAKKINLKSEHLFMGDTGGKDSTLTKFILSKTNYVPKYFKVSYDNDSHARDGHIDCNIINKDLYELYSLSGFKKRGNFISSSQADDIHVTFSAPFINVTEGFPQGIVAGIPWECVKSISNEVGELVPTETAVSLKLYMDMCSAFGLNGFKFYSPLAGLHTFAIYRLLNDIFGRDYLKSLDSCWNSYHIQGNPCGFCPKCYRIKFIFKKVFNENYMPSSPELNNVGADFIFGSLHGMAALDIYESVDKIFFYQKELLFLYEPFWEIMVKDFGLSLNNDEKELGTTSSIEKGWEAIQKKIWSDLNIKYTDLSDEKIHDLDVPQIPFELSYGLTRKNLILSCFSEVPVFIEKTNEWIDIQIPSKTKHKLPLNFPRNDLFKNWLSDKYIFSNYPNLLQLVKE